MEKDQLERLLNEACELLTIYEDSGYASEDDLKRIDSIFTEINYSDVMDNKTSADEEAQDWDTFGTNKI